uniref:Uncharacterized protein n=1 Tax=Arundo donax TaxID=35708 RepID=A0A0A8Z512_ARUDO
MLRGPGYKRCHVHEPLFSHVVVVLMSVSAFIYVLSKSWVASTIWYACPRTRSSAR